MKQSTKQTLLSRQPLAIIGHLTFPSIPHDDKPGAGSSAFVGWPVGHPRQKSDSHRIPSFKNQAEVADLPRQASHYAHPLSSSHAWPTLSTHSPGCCLSSYRYCVHCTLALGDSVEAGGLLTGGPYPFGTSRAERAQRLVAKSRGRFSRLQLPVVLSPALHTALEPAFALVCRLMPFWHLEHVDQL